MLIVTLPSVHQEDLLEEVITHPLVGGARINTGARSPYPPQETLQRVKTLMDARGLPFWVDLKGRQLRIARWGAPEWGSIRLNHEVSIDRSAGPVHIRFRGDETVYRVTHALGSEIFIDPSPQHAVGEGQSVNVVSGRLNIPGPYLIENDRRYIRASVPLGITRFMLSYAETRDDVLETAYAVQDALGDALETPVELVLKVESREGAEFLEREGASALVLEEFPNARVRLMAARDDLGVNLRGDQCAIIAVLKCIIALDPTAIAASKIFASLERGEPLNAADACDLAYLWHLGYGDFLLSDELTRHFAVAMDAWADSLRVVG